MNRGANISFGVCVPLEQSPKYRSAGWDYVEALIQPLLAPHLPDELWQAATQTRASLPVPAANQLLPPSLKVTGPEINWDALLVHMRRVTQRARAVGIKCLVFGSGAARQVPADFDRGLARQQVLRFVRMAADCCGDCGIDLVAEPLNRGECNIINSVSEAMEYVNEVSYPHFKCLADSYHFWLEEDRLEDLRAAAPSIRHVHVADRALRVAPGESGTSDYRPFFNALKHGGYAGSITVETIDIAKIESIPDGARRVLEFLKRQWSEA